MASESLCNAIPQHRRSTLGSNRPSGQDESEIELLSSQELQQMRSEVSQTTTSGILEIAASTQTHIERLKSRVAELEKRLYESRAEVHQVTAEMKQLQRILHQRDQQPARLENEKRAQKFQVHWALDRESLAQKMSALEERIEQLNDCTRALQVKVEDTQPVEDMDIQDVDNQAVEDMDAEDTQPDSLIPAPLSYPKPVENCCAPSVFVHGSLVYELPSACACPVHQDVSPHT